MSDLLPAGAQLTGMRAEFSENRTLHLYRWGGGGCRIVFQQYKRQHFATAPQREFPSYEAARLRWGVLVEKLGRGLEVGEI